MKKRNPVAKDLLTTGKYRRKIHKDRKKADKRKHKERVNMGNKWTDTPVGSTFTTKSGKVIKVESFNPYISGNNCANCYLKGKSNCNNHWCMPHNRIDMLSVIYIQEN